MRRRIESWRAALRSGTLSRQKRWRLLAGVVAFYLVRDVFLYVLLPLFLWARTR